MLTEVMILRAIIISLSLCSFVTSQWEVPSLFEREPWILDGLDGTGSWYEASIRSAAYIKADLIFRSLDDAKADTVVDTMSSKPNYERQMIVDVYDTLYTRPIKTRITGLIPSSCERLIQGLLMDSPVFLARRLLTALSKLETETVSKILLTLWNSEIEVVEKVFNEIAMESGRNKTLEEHIKTYYNRNLSEALLCLTDGKRDENEVIGEIWEGIIKWLPKTNDKIAHLDVVEMKNIFELRDVGSAGKVTQIICRRTPFQLQEDNALFTKMYRQTLRSQLDEYLKEIPEVEYRRLMLYILDYAIHRLELIAKWFQEAITDKPLDAASLQRLLITRSEIDLGDVKKIYEMKYGLNLVEIIKNVTTGCERRAMISLLGEKIKK